MIPLPGWRTFAATTGAGLALACGSCGGHEDEIRVGAYLSLSGSDSTFGTDTRDGIELAVDEINAAGGIHGKRVKVLYEDDKSTTLEASQKVRQLIDRDHVVALLGEVSSSRSLAGGLIANTSGVPMISPSSTAPIVTENRTFVFRTCFTDDQQGAAAARFVRRELKKTRVGVFYAAQDTYSSGLAAAFAAEISALGGEIVIEKGYQKGETNFRTYLSEIRTVNPEMIFVPNYYNEMVLIARQARDAGIPSSSFIGADGWDSPNLVEGAGAELEGAYLTDHYAQDMPGENAAKFFRAFHRKYNREPLGLTAQGHDSAALLFDAIKRTKGATREEIRQAIADTRGFAGATGSISIDAERNAIKPVVIVQIRDKKFKYVTELMVEPKGGPRRAPLQGARPKRDPIRPLKVAEAVVTGVTQGAMIALVALGYTMVYGVLKLINFAHSEVFMMGAYFGIIALAMLMGDATALNGMMVPAAGAGGSLSALLHGHPLVATGVATVLAMLGAAALGVGVERVAYRPLRGRGKGALVRITPLVTALGMSVLLQNVAQLVFSSRFRPYPQILTGALAVPGIGAISTSRILILVAAVIVMVGLELIVKRTWFGKSMRALSANEEAARLMGIRTSRVISTTFALGSALAALGSVLFCLDQSEVYPTMGVIIGTRAFVAAVLGGIGSITGAMLGGLVIGIIGELVKLTDYSGGVDVLVFGVLILVLLVRPSGLLGSTRAEKV